MASYRAEPMQREEHRDALLRLWGENMPDPAIAAVTPARFRWLYDQNPAGAASTWLGVHGPTDEVIGCGSFAPRRMWVDGQLLDAGILADFAVAKNHRTAGAAIAIQRAVSKGAGPAGLAFLLCYPNDAALPIFKRVRYKPVGEAGTWVKPLHAEYKLREHLPSPRLAKLAAYPVDAGLWARDLPTFARSPRPYRTRLVDRADQSFDQLSDRARPGFITGERSSAYLNWRYADFTSATYRFFCLHRPTMRLRAEHGDLLGYVVYEIQDNRVFVADLFCDYERDTSLLLHAFAARMRRAGHYSISLSYFGSRFLADELEAQHFIPRPDKRHLLVLFDKQTPEPLARALTDPERWLMADGELDL